MGVQENKYSSRFATCSLDAFQFAATAKADKNLDGKIDENEKPIFDNYMKQFDMNGDGKIDGSDVKAFEKTVAYTEEEEAARKEWYSLLDKYGLSKDFKTQEEYSEAYKKVPKEVLKQMDELIHKFTKDGKHFKHNTWNFSISSALADYFAKLSDDAKINLFEKFGSYFDQGIYKDSTIDFQ